MEQKDLIFLDTGTNDSFVLVERNKKRQKEKQRQNLKRGVAIILLFVIIFGAIKLFPYAKDFLKNQGNEPSNDNINTIPSTDDSNQESDTSLNADTSTNKDSNISTSTDQDGVKNEESDKNGETSSEITSTESENDTDTETSVGTDVNNDTEMETDFPNSSDYKILDVGATKYTAINESGCEFDFSVKFSKVTLSEIRKKYGADSPIVLITHSQRNEAYSNGKSYSTDGPFYSESNNVAELGKIICQRLNAYGIPAIQLNELYASGTIHSSKKEYEKSLQETLARYPSISYVFNISRGISINDDLSMNKSYTTQGNEKVAQISITSGTSWDTASKNQIENVRFAFDFTKFVTRENTNFIKKNTISRYALSQNNEPLCANIDIGEFSNSFEEAKRSAEFFATLLYKYLVS